jgi:hypothetical protein
MYTVGNIYDYGVNARSRGVSQGQVRTAVDTRGAASCSEA